jgi:hypothetical protein
MSEVPFYMTRMGRRYYEHTVPELVTQLARLNELLERLTERLEKHDPDSKKEP